MTEREEILLLRKENLELRVEIVGLKQIVEELMQRFNKNSSNSSKPPSNDIQRTKSLGSSSDKKAGAQARTQRQYP